MRHELPAKPNLEHLKSQAKDLVDAHRRGDPEAFARIRAAVPAFAHRSDEAIARGPFALHDAQSAIAREYGCASWAELRAKVLAVPDAAPEPGPSLAELQTASGRTLSPELEAAVRAALALRGTQFDAPTPPSLPVIPLRNAVVFPGAIIPIDVNRPTSLAAIEAAMHGEPRFLAIFSQRALETERPTRDELHPTGCLCIVRVFHRKADTESTAWILIEGVRAITLEALDQVDPYYVARVADTSIDPGDAQQVAALERQLRALALRFIEKKMEGTVQVGAREAIDATTEPRKLADLVMANLPMPVADMASYAEETQLSRRLERAIAVLTAALP